MIYILFIYYMYIFFCEEANASEVIPHERNFYVSSVSGNQNMIFFSNGEKLFHKKSNESYARRTEFSTGGESSPFLSPDAKKLAYIVTDGVTSEIFVAFLNEDLSQVVEPQRLTFDGSSDIHISGWLNDKEILYSTTIKSGKRGPLLYTVNVSTLRINEIPLMEAYDGCLINDYFIFVKNEQLLDNNKKYKGGYAQKIYRIKKDFLNGEFVDIESVELMSESSTINRNPICVAGQVYFLSNKSGAFNIWSVNVESLTYTQHTFEIELWSENDLVQFS